MQATVGMVQATASIAQITVTVLLRPRQGIEGERTSRILLAAVLRLKVRWPNRSQREGSQTLRLDSVDQRCLRQLMY